MINKVLKKCETLLNILGIVPCGAAGTGVSNDTMIQRTQFTIRTSANEKRGLQPNDNLLSMPMQPALGQLYVRYTSQKSPRSIELFSPHTLRPQCVFAGVTIAVVACGVATAGDSVSNPYRDSDLSFCMPW